MTWSDFPRLTRSLRLHPVEICRVRVLAFPLRLSASAPGFDLHWHPPPPNNSFKPTPHRGVNSVLCATLHAVATPTRAGLTQALGGRKAFGSFAFQHGDFTGFGWCCSSVGFMRRCFFGYSFRRARTSRALRWSASETVIDVVMFPATDTVASVTSGGKFSGARTDFPAPAFGKFAKVRFTSASPAT